MKRILAHSEKDAQKRRAAFEERYAVFNGHHLSLEGIKRKVNPNLEIKYLCYYLGESNKFSGKPNPIVCLADGKFSFSEQGIREALKKMGADLSQFKMEVQETARDADGQSRLVAYKKRKNVYALTCTLAYKGIEMEITRWHVKDSPFGLFEIMPAKQMLCYVSEHFKRDERFNLFVLRDDEFYLLDLPTFLMDLALEYQLREEEIIFHAKQQRISTMQTSVLDEDHIMLDAIDEATVERIIKESEQKGLDKEQTFKVLVAPWMEAIHDYLAQMTSKYKDFVYMFNLEIEPGVNGCSSSLFTRTAKYNIETGIVPQVPFKKLCEERQLEVSYTFSKNSCLSCPSRRQTVACFTVEDSEIIIDEVLYDQLWHKDQLIIYPNAKDRRFQLQISGSIGLHALVGYLKQMPALCQQMNKFAESLKL